MSQKLTPITLKNMEKRMNSLLQRLGLNFTVSWQPGPTREQHAKVDPKQHIIYIYDVSEEESWQSLFHEVLELKLRPVLSFYRGVVNSLIDLIEKEAYARKEHFLNEIPSILSEFQKRKKLIE